MLWGPVAELAVPSHSKSPSPVPLSFRIIFKTYLLDFRNTGSLTLSYYDMSKLENFICHRNLCGRKINLVLMELTF